MKKVLVSILIMMLIIPFTSNAQWPDDPSLNLEVVEMDNGAAVPKIAFDDNGNYYIGFYSIEPNYNIRVQRLDSDGNYLWGSEGLLVSEHEQNSWISEWDMTVDNEGNCILAFADVRTGNPDIQAYKISPEGDFIWGADGVNLSNNPAEEFAPVICITDDNSAIFAWELPGVEFNSVQLHKLTASGDLSWGDDGIVYSGTDISYTGPRLVEAGNDFILGFYKQTGPFFSPTRHVYAQKFTPDAIPVWAEDILASAENGISGWTDLNARTDENNGVILGWHDDRDNNMIMDAAMQHINDDGSLAWPVGGVELAMDEGSNYSETRIAGVSSDGGIIAAFDYSDNNQNNRGVKAQKIDTDGNRVWGDDAKIIEDFNGGDASAIDARVYNNITYVTFQKYDFGGVMESSAYAMAVKNDGTFEWDNKTLISSRQTSRTHSVMSEVKNDQMLIAWEDGLDNEKIYTQNFNLDGSIGTGGTTLNDDAYLFTLLVNGIAVEGFDANIFDYEMVLEVGSDLPIVTAFANDNEAILDITQITEFPGTASVLVTAENGIAQNTYTVDFMLNIGIDDLQNNKLSVYPNPAKEYIQIHSNIEVQSIRILSLLGQTIYQNNNVSSNQISVSTFESGIYLIEAITINGNKTVTKFVKK